MLTLAIFKITEENGESMSTVYLSSDPSQTLEKISEILSFLFNKS